MVFGLSLIFFLSNKSIAQVRPLYSTGRMVNSNVQVLDSAEKASMPRMVLLEDTLSIEKKETIDEIAKLSTEYPIERGKN